MAFGKRNTIDKSITQDNVAMLATKALAKSRETCFRLGVRLTLEEPGMLMHRWGQKAIIEMVGKMVGQPQPRPPKHLTEEYEAAAYRNTNGALALPCRIVKACIVEGAISTGGVVSKAELKRSLRVLGQTSPVMKNGKPLAKAEIDCRIASNNGTPDMRARALVPGGCTLDVVLQFSSALTPDKVIAALSAAGATIGLCDNRPERGGDYGTFTIEVLDDKMIDRVLRDCAHPEEVYTIPPEMMRAFNTDMAKSDAAKKVVDLVNGSAKRRAAGRAEA